MTGELRGQIQHHRDSRVSLGPRLVTATTPGMFLPHAVAAVEGQPTFDTLLVAAEGRAKTIGEIYG